MKQLKKIQIIVFPIFIYVKISANHHAAIISLVTHFPKPVEHYKKLLDDFHKLSHITIEVHECKTKPCITPKGDIA